jgi:hypothetical protein
VPLLLLLYILLTFVCLHVILDFSLKTKAQTRTVMAGDLDGIQTRRFIYVQHLKLCELLAFIRVANALRASCDESVVALAARDRPSVHLPRDDQSSEEAGRTARSMPDGDRTSLLAASA